jgi:hypothetical protein
MADAAKQARVAPAMAQVRWERSKGDSNVLDMFARFRGISLQSELLATTKL